VHHAADGSVHCRGIWAATALTGWRDFGPAGPGRHGGVLAMLVTHHCTTMGGVHVGIPMTVTSTWKLSDGSGYLDGVAVGDFTESTGGAVVIAG